MAKKVYWVSTTLDGKDCPHKHEEARDAKACAERRASKGEDCVYPIKIHQS